MRRVVRLVMRRLLALAVAALALLAAATDVCVGCEAYVLLKKWTASPVQA